MACSWAKRTAALAVDELLVLLEVLVPVAVVDLSELVLVLVAVVKLVALEVVDEVVEAADAFRVPQVFS